MASEGVEPEVHRQEIAGFYQKNLLKG